MQRQFLTAKQWNEPELSVGGLELLAEYDMLSRKLEKNLAQVRALDQEIYALEEDLYHLRRILERQGFVLGA